MDSSLRFRVECVNPILNVSSISTSLDFYTRLLGFKAAEWGTEGFTSVAREGGCIYLSKGGQGGPGTWIWLGFDGDIFQLYHELLSAGVKIVLPPTNFSWAMEMQVEDPDGHVIRLGTDPDPSRTYKDLVS